jgi:hypothetical protein
MEAPTESASPLEKYMAQGECAAAAYIHIPTSFSPVNAPPDNLPEASHIKSDLCAMWNLL